jgi:hypothetical protein
MITAACGLSIFAIALVKSEDARHRRSVSARSRSLFILLMANDPLMFPIQSSGELPGMGTSPARSSSSLRVASARLIVARCCSLIRCRNA